MGTVAHTRRQQNKIKGFVVVLPTLKDINNFLLEAIRILICLKVSPSFSEVLTSYLSSFIHTHKETFCAVTILEVTRDFFIQDMETRAPAGINPWGRLKFGLLQQSKPLVNTNILWLNISHQQTNLTFIVHNWRGRGPRRMQPITQQ